MISKLPYKLFKVSRAFSTVIRSVPGNLPPVREDTVAGRYAGVLFKIASGSEKLDTIAQDMEFFDKIMSEVGINDMRAGTLETLFTTLQTPRQSWRLSSRHSDLTLTSSPSSSSRP